MKQTLVASAIFQVIPAQAGIHPFYEDCRFPQDLDGLLRQSPPARVPLRGNDLPMHGF
jgi:hypothetical protein